MEAEEEAEVTWKTWPRFWKWILLEISLSVASSILLLLVHSFLNGTQKKWKATFSFCKGKQAYEQQLANHHLGRETPTHGFFAWCAKKFLADQKAKKEDNFLFSSADFYKGVHVNGALSIPDTVPTHRNIVCISLHVPIWKWFCFFFLRRFTRLLNKHWRYGQNLSLIGKVAHGNSSLISGLKITAMLSDFVFCLHFQQYCFLIFVLWLMEKAWATRGAIFSW